MQSYLLKMIKAHLKMDINKKRLLSVVVGAVGFFAFSFTIIGGIAGGVLGIVLGRYAGKKIVRKAKEKTLLTEFALFTTKLECMMKWMKLERKKCEFNINNYRFVLEKVRITHFFNNFFMNLGSSKF